VTVSRRIIKHHGEREGVLIAIGKLIQLVAEGSQLQTCVNITLGLQKEWTGAKAEGSSY
jgi:hypothetical protein